MRDIVEAESFRKFQSPLALGLGRDVSGHPIAADLAGMPHLLIAGTTGSGKSVCVNAIVACLLMQNTPDSLKFVMVDPKRVELTFYNGIPHLLAPVVVELERVVPALQWVSREMDKRYHDFAREGVRNIGEFNARLRAEGKKELYYLVVVIDELADLMMLAPDETERVITRLAQLARATGIHLVIATQRPSVDVVTGLIKANFPARIAFAVASSVDSRVILDQPGAERLLGRGDMLFQSPDSPAPVRMQGAFVSEPELSRLMDSGRTLPLSSWPPHRRPPPRRPPSRPGRHSSKPPCGRNWLRKTRTWTRSSTRRSASCAACAGRRFRFCSGACASGTPARRVWWTNSRNAASSARPRRVPRPEKSWIMATWGPRTRARHGGPGAKGPRPAEPWFASDAFSCYDSTTVCRGVIQPSPGRHGRRRKGVIADAHVTGEPIQPRFHTGEVLPKTP